MNIIKFRYLYFAISLVVIIPGLIALILWGLPLGIDFTGGSLLEVQFASGNPPSITEVATVYSQLSTPTVDISDPVVQPVGSDSLSIRSKEMNDVLKSQIVAALQDQYGGGQNVVITNFTQVSAVIGQEVAVRAAGAVALAALAILIYITYRFPRGSTCIPLRDSRHHCHAARRAGGPGNGSHYRSFPGLASRLTLPDRPADSYRFLGARYDRGFRPHSGKFKPVPQSGVRDSCQSLNRPDPGPVDQYPTDGNDHAAGIGTFRRDNHPSFRDHPFNRRIQRNIFIDL